MEQSTRPRHHANASRSLFQNPWMTAESTAAPPPHAPRPTPPKSTANYWPARSLSSSLQLPTLQCVRASASHPHPPVKVVKPDWGVRCRSTTTSADPSPSSDSEQPNLKATWLGHAVRPAPALSLSLSPPLHCIYFSNQSFIVEFPRVVVAGSRDEPARVLFDPIFSECAGPSPWVGIRRRLPAPCTVAELPEFQFVVYSHNQ